MLIGLGITVNIKKRVPAIAGPPAIPVNISIPTIAGPNPPRVGDTLNCIIGQWTGKPNPTYAFQWKRGVTNVGVNQNTYVPVVGDVAGVITCQVTATNTQGSASATSLGTLPVEVAGTVPVNTILPAVSGDAFVGGLLTTTNGTWTGSPTPTFTYQWQGNVANIGGATQSTFVVTPTQLGQTVRCVVTATNVNGAVPAISNSTSAITNPVAAPVNTVPPVITGTTVVGQTLSTTNGTWEGNPVPTFTYAWQRDNVNIASATAATYLLVSADLGAIIRCRVTGTNSQGNSTATSNTHGPVLAAPSLPVNTVLPAITGVVKVGETLTCSTGTWTGEPTPTFTYQWHNSNLGSINGGTNATYVIVQSDEGFTLHCTVTATNTQGSVSIDSNSTVPVAPPAAQTIAEQLLGAETNGIAIGFQDNSLLIRDTVTPANNFEGGIFPKLTFTRASSATYYNSAGLIATAATNAARINYNPATLVAQGLLIEEARTNNFTYSEDLSNAIWNKSSSTISANATTAPDGTVTADKIVEVAASAQHYVVNGSFTGVAASVYSWTCYIKAAERTFCWLEFYGGFSAGTAYVDLATGAIGTTSGIGSGVTATEVGNGWYRLQLPNATATAASMNVAIYTSTGDGVNSFLGDITKGIYIWGTQLELGDVASSYIPTTTIAVTRADDKTSILTTLFNYSATFGSMYANASILAVRPGVYSNLTSFNDTTAAERVDIYTPSGAPSLVVTDNSATVVNINAGAVSANTSFKTAAAWALNDFAIVLNAGSPSVSASGTLPTINRLHIGMDYASLSQLNGHITELRYVPRRMTNTELQTITTPVVVVVPPANSVAPVISGTPTVGQTLSCTTGTWSGSPNPLLTYQWFADDIAIGTALSSTFLLTSAQFSAVMTCVVTGTNTAGALPVTSSNSLGPVANAGAPPANTVIPSITGTTTVGSTLTCQNGTWTGTPAPSFTYRWFLNDVAINGQITQTYVIQAGDASGFIHAEVTGTNTNGTDSEVTLSVGPIGGAQATPLHHWPLDSTHFSLLAGGITDIGSAPITGTATVWGSTNMSLDDGILGAQKAVSTFQDGYVALASQPLPGFTSPYTFMGWFRLFNPEVAATNGGTEQTLFSCFVNSSNWLRVAVRYQSGNQGYVTIRQNFAGTLNQITSNSRIFYRNYETHLAFTQNGAGAWQIYANGVLIPSTLSTPGVLSACNGNYIMARNAPGGSGGQPVGSVASVRIYDSILSGAEIQAIFDNEATSGVQPTGAGLPDNLMCVFNDDFSGNRAQILQRWQTNWLGPTQDATISKSINSFETCAVGPNGVTVAASELTLTAVSAPGTMDYQGNTWDIYSGLLNSGGQAYTTSPYFQYAYGFCEARIWMPSTGANVGLALDNWPAWWTNGNHAAWGDWPGAGENDFTEGLGVNGQPTVSSSRMHYHAPTPEGSSGGGADWNQSYTYGGNGALANAWHIYGCMWEPGKLQYFLDGALVRTLTDSRVLGIPQYLVLNLGMSNGYPGGPQRLPGTFKIDWVRVYQAKP